MIRTRIAAAIAAVGLIGFAVFGGAISASAGPLTAPVLDLPLGGPDADDQPQAEGTIAVEGADVDVIVRVTNSLGTSTYCTDTVIAGQVDFSCVGAVLPYGDNTFTATSTYTLGMPDAFESPTSNAVVYTHYGMQAVALTVTPPAVTSDATPTFSGTGPSLGTVDVRSNANTLCSTAVAADGTWSCDAAPPLVAGLYASISARGTDMGSLVTYAYPADFTIAAPSAPSVDQTFDPWITSDDRPSIQGNKDLDSSYIQGYWSTDGVNWTGYCQVSTGVGATVWFCDPAFSSIPLGTVLVAAIAFNEADDASPMGTPITIERVAEPVIVSPADGSFTNDTTPTISGTATGTDITMWYFGEAVLCSAPITLGSFSCTPSSPLADGTYEYTALVTPGSSVWSGPWTFTVDTLGPESPIITGPSVPLATTSSTHPTISGTGEPGATVEVFIDGVAKPCVGGAATVDQFGSWSCQIAPTQSPGSYEYAARQTDRAGNTNGGPLVTQLGLTIIAPPPAPAPAPLPSPTPSPTSTPTALLPWTFDFGLDDDELEPGDTTLITGSGLPPGATVDVEFHSTPVLLGSTVVKPDGTFTLLVTVPEDAEPGEHHFVVLVTPVDAPPSVQDQAVKVIDPDETVAPGSDQAAATTDDDGAGGGDRSEPAAPSSLTGTIQTLASVISNPVIIGTAALSGFVLLLFVAFPAELLNSTLSEQYQRFSRRVPKLTALERFTNWLERMPWLGGIAITVVAAFIFGFADPGFGFDVTSLRVVLACAIALFIVGYLASSIAGLIIRGRWNLATSMELKPLGLVLTVIGVVLSRFLDFSPGFLIGLLLGIGLVGRTTVGDRARATLVQAGVVFVLSILGWVGYSIMMTAGSPDGFVSALALDTMVAVTTEGLTALFIGLLPFRLLDGSAIFEHSKVVWAAAYAIAAAAFVLIVVPSAWGEFDGSLWLWIAVVGGFAAVALAIYLYFRFFAKPVDEDEDEAVELTGARR